MKKEGGARAMVRVEEENFELVMMKEEGTNPLIELRKQLLELSGGICDIGPGPYGIGASAVSDSEMGFYLVFEPKCYTDTETFPEGIPEYKVSVQGFYQKKLQEEKEEAAESEEQEERREQAESGGENTEVVVRVLKEMEGKEIMVSRDQCLEALELMADEIMKSLKADGAGLDFEEKTQEQGMVQQF